MTTPNPSEKEMDFGIHESEVNGVKLTCKYRAPGLTMHDLVRMFDAASKTGNDFAGNPVEWPIHKGLNAILDAVIPAVYARGVEDAARVAEKCTTVRPNWGTREAIAAQIRALIEGK